MVEVKSKFEVYDEVQIVHGEGVTTKHIGESGVVVQKSFEHGGWNYLVNSDSEKGDSPSFTWWYPEDFLKQPEILSQDFNILTSEEKSAFIREIVGQLYLTPQAYVKYKRLQESLSQ